MRLPLSRERLLNGLIGTEGRLDSMFRCPVSQFAAQPGTKQALQENKNPARWPGVRCARMLRRVGGASLSVHPPSRVWMLAFRNVLAAPTTRE